MLKKTLISVTAGGLLTMAAAAENTAIASKKWEVGIGAAGFIEGSSGDGLQSTGAYALRTNYRFKPAWSLTGEYMFSPNGNYRDRDDRTDIHRVIASVDWDAYPDDYYSPYLAAGIGYEEFSGDASNRNGALAAFGGGIRFNFTETIGVNLEAKYKMNLDHQDTNVLLTGALNYRFGTSGDNAE